MALVVLVLVEGFAALALASASTRYRLTSDVRLAIESQMRAASALATARLEYADTLRALSNGDHLTLPAEPLGQGWFSRAEAVRSGPIVRLLVTAERRTEDGRLLAGRRVTLLLVRGATDTLRVLRSRARF